MSHILVTGSKGQLGSEFFDIHSAYPNFSFHFKTKAQLDITNDDALKMYFEANNIQYCINCAAYTAVDLAESESTLAKMINTDAAGLLSRHCSQSNIPIIHFSTDYVYDSDQSTPYLESDLTYPKGVYARTKLEGEKRVLEENDLAIVIRTSWVYSTFGKNFFKTMLRLGKEQAEVKVVDDQIGTPTYARDIAKATLHIINFLEERQENRATFAGIYNYSNEGICSWYEFAKHILSLAELDCKALPIKSSDYPTAAHRPKYSAMDKTKIKEIFNLEIPHWLHSLKGMIKRRN